MCVYVMFSVSIGGSVWVFGGDVGSRVGEFVRCRDGKSTRNRKGKLKPKPVGSGSGRVGVFGCGFRY